MTLPHKIIIWAFYTLFLGTPLFFWPGNSELFEFNKMRLVYGLTVVITTAWVLRMIQERSFIVKQTPLDIPILLFLASQIISTVFSIDLHTSIWGYYSRSNGGLLSVISYILLFYAFVSNIPKENLFKQLKVAVTGGVLVSLYAIPEHFGLSPSCLILTGNLNATCWVQDVQARVFATLGQPNWLAAYLAMIIFPAIYFALTETKRKSWYLVNVLLIYMAFTFTYSRGGMLGFLAGLGILGAILLFHQYKAQKLTFKNPNIKFITIIAVIIIITNLLFGSALTGNFRLLKQHAPPARPGIVQSGTQLENGGTESGQIRLIVWQGAIDIFKAHPLFGSGVETFAYSYYQFRPLTHNLVSEWDFLYNKAHNEYLNYLATTGIVGLVSYLIMVITFIKFILMRLRKTNLNETILLTTLLAGYTSFLVQNIFGFSVVIIAVLFFLFPTFVFVATDSVFEPSKSFTKFFNFLKPILSLLYKRQAYTTIALIIVLIFGLAYLMKVYSNWEADTYYKLGNDYTDEGYVGEGFNNLIEAIDLHPTEPLYRADLGFTAAAVAVSRFDRAETLTTEGDASSAAELKEEANKMKDLAVAQTELALEISPRNTSLWRTAVRTYYQLVPIDPTFADKTIETFDKTIALAPTDPKLVYNKALIQASQNKLPDAIQTLQKALELKPDYRDAKITLSDFYYRNKENQKAVTIIEDLLKKTPEDQDLNDRLTKYQGVK